MRRSRGSLVGPRAGGHAVLLGCGLDLSLRSMKGFAASLHQPKKVKISLDLSENRSKNSVSFVAETKIRVHECVMRSCSDSVIGRIDSDCSSMAVFGCSRVGGNTKWIEHPGRTGEPPV